MLCKRAALSALAVVAAVGSVSAAPQNFDLDAILGQFTAVIPGINSLLKDPAFLASVSKQMGAFNEILAKNPGLMSDILNGKIPTELNALIPTDLLDDLKITPTSKTTTSKPTTKPEDDKPADDKSADDKSEDDKPEDSKTKPNAAANLKPVAGLFAAGIVAAAALF
ncbi:hypothetical protein GGH95_001963 [Coemansia sp. RSA 1836]|nr:hypothetical protein GGH95_001963 [Coemansia sp. RSA 1836]